VLVPSGRGGEAFVAVHTDVLPRQLRQAAVPAEHKLIVAVVVSAISSAHAGDAADQAWLTAEAEQWLSWIAPDGLTPAELLARLRGR
jgi:hypothetical protein